MGYRSRLAGALAGAVLLAGCGSTADAPRLSTSGRSQLIADLGHARTAASAHNLPGLRSALAEFDARVSTLLARGELSSARAGLLKQQAAALERQASVSLAAHVTSSTPTTSAASTAEATATTATVATPAPSAGPAGGPGPAGGAHPAHPVHPPHPQTPGQDHGHGNGNGKGHGDGKGPGDD